MHKKLFLFLFIVGFIFSFSSASADDKKVDYAGQVVVDRDLDGLTDEGEKQIFLTDQQKADSDEDGFTDGVEVLSETDPLSKTSFPGIVQDQQIIQDAKVETPWPWYAARAAGLVAFILLYISIFLGLTLRIPLARKIFKPLYAMNIHCWISLQATVIAFLHGGVLIFDKFLHLSLVDIFVPFVSSYQRALLPLGILGFYLMIMLVVTSYMRKHISQKVWRITHFSNIALYLMVIGHAVGLGTDLKKPLVFDIFLFANAFLVFLMLVNMQLRIAEAHRRRKEAALASQSNTGPEEDQGQESSKF